MASDTEATTVITSRMIHNLPLLDVMRSRPPIDLSSRRGEVKGEPDTLCQNSDVAICYRRPPEFKSQEKGNRNPMKPGIGQLSSARWT
jgi:hypothetical protein